MHKINNLGFVIGVFFILISLVLIIGGLSSAALAHKLNFYTGFSFLVFGVLMAFLNRKDDKDVQT
jgi:uncharacterized membrane protein